MSRRIVLKIVLPVLVLLVGGGAFYLIIAFRPRVERRVMEFPPPLVRVVRAHHQDLSLNVYSQGTVTPRTETTLAAEVAGRIESVAPRFAEGGFFAKGDALVRIDPRDYRLAVSGAEAEVARARVRLDLEEAEAEVARQEWSELGSGEPTALTLREPQLAEARAALQAAQAALDRARLDLSRTVIRAPYDGRIRDKIVDLGQYLSPGTPLAVIYATDRAEIRLPIPRHEIRYLDLDLGSNNSRSGPLVTVRGEFGGGVQSWPGRIVRTDSGFDPRTRMLDLFAQIDDPYRRAKGADGPPLPMGMFVEAEISGLTAEGVVVLPRTSLRDGNRVLIVDEENRLRYRPVEPLRIRRDQLILRAGVEEGELVCISVLETVTDGMRVRPIAERDDPTIPPEVEPAAGPGPEEGA